MTRFLLWLAGILILAFLLVVILVRVLWAVIVLGALALLVLAIYAFIKARVR